MLITSYQAGKTTRELAAEIGCCKTTVSNLLRQHGVNVTKSKARTKIVDNKVIAMYENMHTAEEIAEQFKVSRYTIIECLRDHGIKIRSRWDYPEK